MYKGSIFLLSAPCTRKTKNNVGENVFIFMSSAPRQLIYSAYFDHFNTRKSTLVKYFITSLNHTRQIGPFAKCPRCRERTKSSLSPSRRAALGLSRKPPRPTSVTLCR
ncbi:hypothetical protein PUN28_000356 [Cardiocondyla obscurior]|uniref:Uncharacterized protein n=1 Tax=Cardiocondyla obscurior TaxID=286306 RepID=A0AAW2GZ51_9HYME